MATVTKPIALDESLNTTEVPSRNVADVLAEELSAIASAIGGGGGQGGHTIEGADGTALSQEPTLQFADADATDDAVNEKTVVNVVRKRTQAQYDDMSAEDKAKGIINVTDANAKPLFASQVRYGTGTVADALTWHEAASYIDALYNAVSEIALVGYADVNLTNKMGIVLIVPKILITDTYRFFQVGDRYNTSNQWHLQARMSIYGADGVGLYKDASEDSTATYKWLYK